MGNKGGDNYKTENYFTVASLKALVASLARFEEFKLAGRTCSKDQNKNYTLRFLYLKKPR